MPTTGSPAASSRGRNTNRSVARRQVIASASGSGLGSVPKSSEPPLAPAVDADDGLAGGVEPGAEHEPLGGEAAGDRVGFGVGARVGSEVIRTPSGASGRCRRRARRRRRAGGG